MNERIRKIPPIIHLFLKYSPGYKENPAYRQIGISQEHYGILLNKLIE